MPHLSDIGHSRQIDVSHPSSTISPSSHDAARPGGRSTGAFTFEPDGAKLRLQVRDAVADHGYGATAQAISDQDVIRITAIEDSAIVMVDAA